MHPHHPPDPPPEPPDPPDETAGAGETFAEATRWGLPSARLLAWLVAVGLLLLFALLVYLVVVGFWERVATRLDAGAGPPPAVRSRSG